MTKVVVPLDGSKLAEAALDKALSLMDNRDVTLILLRVVESIDLPSGAADEPGDVAVQEAAEYLAGVAARTETDHVRVAKAIWFGSPAGAIIEAAELMDVDLLVMSTHGRSGISRWMMGSVAESVVHGTARPILLVRAPGAPVSAPAGSERARPAAP
jgi:nucleotide-binding universal stress UspA family protein